MKLERIELRNTGPFADTVGVGPLADGLNVLAAGNEAGKTTLLMGGARALFDRHNVTGEGIERLQPVGTSLAPEISVVFATVNGRFKIGKRFLHSPSSELSEDRDGEWHPISEGDAADGRVLDLIGGVRPGRGVSKAEHWGFLRYLWARQGETADWPELDDATGANIRSGLAQVEIDPLVERLRKYFQEAQAEQFTSTGRVSKNSQLQLAEQAVEKLESNLTEVRSQMDQVDRQLQELQQFHDGSAVRGREKAEAEEKAKTLTESLKKVELLQKDIQRFQGSFSTAQERLNEIHSDRQTLGKAENGLEEAKKERAQRQTEESRARREEKETREGLAADRDGARLLQEKLDLGRKSETRMREIQELRNLEGELAILRKRLDTVRKQNRSLDQLRRKRVAVPDVKKRQVTRLEQREQELRELDVRAEAVGLRVSIEPVREVAISIERDGVEETRSLTEGKATTVTTTRNLRLKLLDWGAIDIASGAEEATEIERQITESRDALGRDLKKLGVASLEHARTSAEQIKDLDGDIKAAESQLTELLQEWDSLDTLRDDVEKTEGQSEQRRGRLNLSKPEEALSQTELKAELAKIRAALGADDSEWAALQKSIETQGKRLETLSATREEAYKSVNDAKKRIASLEAQRKTIKDRYPDGIAKAEESAQASFVEAKAQFDVARKKLPDDWDKLEPRHERALRSEEQATRDYQELEQKIRRLETLLDHAGSQGLYSRETKLEEELASAKKEAARLRNHALAARFVAGLIDYRKKGAVRTVLKPLEDQLSATFADITGVRNRKVFLDENLQVAGIGRKWDETILFNQLSQGAREQLLLALRAAVALELARHGPQILILDDVLVNTDSTRQENVLDFIQNIAQHVQVLIVTCHAERYRGLGHTVNIEPVQSPE